MYGDELRAGRARRGAEGPPITASAIKSVDSGALIDRAIEQVAAHASQLVNIGEVMAGAEYTVNKKGEFSFWTAEHEQRAKTGALQLRRRRSVNDELLREVAAVYLDEPDAPTEAVADEFDVSKRTATRWVAAARDRGLLPPYEQQKTEEVSTWLLNRSTNCPQTDGRSATGTRMVGPVVVVSPGAWPRISTPRSAPRPDPAPGSRPELGKVAFGKWVDEWRATTVHLRSATRTRYERDLNLHIRSRFEHAPLVRITPRDVRAWVSEMQASGIPASSVRRRFSVFRKVMGDAVTMEMIARSPLSWREATG